MLTFLTMPVLHSLVRVPQLQGELGRLEQRNAVEFCEEPASEEWDVMIGNEGDADESAAAISADQVSLKSVPILFRLFPTRQATIRSRDTRHTVLDVR